MGQEQLLSVVEAFNASKRLAGQDREQLSELQKMAAAASDGAPSATQDTISGTVRQGLLARSNADKIVYYPSGNDVKYYFKKIEMPTVKSVGFDLIKNWATSTAQERIKQEGGAWVYVSWAWEGGEAAVKLVTPGHPAVKVFQVGKFICDKVIEIQKIYLDKKTAEMATEVDWVLKAHTDVIDHVIAVIESQVQEAILAAGKVLPKWGFDKQGFMQRIWKEVAGGQTGNGSQGRDSVRSLLRQSVLNDMAYLHDMRASVYSLGAASDTFAAHCNSFAAHVNSTFWLPKEMKHYKGLVHEKRGEILRMYAKDLSDCVKDARLTLERVVNTEDNLWSLIGSVLSGE